MLPLTIVRGEVDNGFCYLVNSFVTKLFRVADFRYSELRSRGKLQDQVCDVCAMAIRVVAFRITRPTSDPASLGGDFNVLQIYASVYDSDLDGILRRGRLLGQLLLYLFEVLEPTFAC